jgi:hypothetical protein
MPGRYRHSWCRLPHGCLPRRPKRSAGHPLNRGFDGEGHTRNKKSSSQLFANGSRRTAFFGRCKRGERGGRRLHGRSGSESRERGSGSLGGWLTGAGTRIARSELRYFAAAVGSPHVDSTDLLPRLNRAFFESTEFNGEYGRDASSAGRLLPSPFSVLF